MSFHALFLAVSHFINCLGSEWHSCPAFSPPATIIFLLFLIFEGLLFALFTAIMFGTQISAIWYDETVSEKVLNVNVKILINLFAFHSCRALSLWRKKRQNGWKSLVGKAFKLFLEDGSQYDGSHHFPTFLQPQRRMDTYFLFNGINLNFDHFVSRKCTADTSNKVHTYSDWVLYTLLRPKHWVVTVKTPNVATCSK